MGLLHEFLEQLAVVQRAWMPFVLAVAIAAIVIWRAMEWRYGGMIERLKNKLEGQPARPSPSPVALKLKDPEKDTSGKVSLTLRRA